MTDVICLCAHPKALHEATGRCRDCDCAQYKPLDNLTHTVHTISACPVCFMRLDMATGFNGDTPRGGDICLCLGCDTLLIYRDDLTVRKMTDLEKLKMPVWMRRQMKLMKEGSARAREAHKKKRISDDNGKG